MVGEIRVVKPARDFWQVARAKKRFPSRMAQFCTEHLKIIPGHERIADSLDAGLRVIKATGVRHDEGHSSNDRGSVPAVAYEAISLRLPGPVKRGGKAPRAEYVYPIWYPIRAWTIDDVWAIHQRYLSLNAVVGLVEADPEMAEDRKATLIDIMRRGAMLRNPLYDMGARRVGCFPCINSAKPELHAMQYYRPERIDFIAAQEENFPSSYNFSSFLRGQPCPCAFAVVSSTKMANRSSMTRPASRCLWPRFTTWRPGAAPPRAATTGNVLPQ